MPLFKSFRSKSSLKSSAASVRSENNEPTDFGPRSPSSNTFASKKNSDYGGSMGRASKQHRGLTSSPSAASVRTSGSVATPKQQFAPQASLMEAVHSANGSGSHATANTGPRPSELFAGKGVQWESVKLAGPGSSPADQQRTTNNTEDLQNFLKMRRQWKPTFVTEESAPRNQAPTDLNQLTFLSHDLSLNKAGLMSLDELDKSHQRKQKLLSDNPLGASLWEDAETSKAGEARAAAAAAHTRTYGGYQPSTTTTAVQSRSIDPPAKRGSSRSASMRKATPKSKQTDSAAVATPAVPQAPVRSSSTQAVDSATGNAASLANGAQNGTHAEVAEVSAPDRSNLPSPFVSTPGVNVNERGALGESGTSATAAATSSGVRPSMDTSAGFATPDAISRPESSSELAQIPDGQAAAHVADTSANLTASNEPATPRATAVE